MIMSFDEGDVQDFNCLPTFRGHFMHSSISEMIFVSLRWLLVKLMNCDTGVITEDPIP